MPATPRGRTPDLDLLKEALSALFVDCIEVYVYLSCSGLSSMIKAWEMRRVLKGMRLQEVNVDRSVDEFLAGCRDKVGRGGWGCLDVGSRAMVFVGCGV